MREASRRLVGARRLIASAVSWIAATTACGPAETSTSNGGSEGSSATSVVESTSTTGASAYTSSTTQGASTGESSTSGSACVDNVANEPWCYRAFTLDGGARRGPHGRFGPQGEPRFFVSFDLEAPTLLGWDGTAVIVEPQAQIGDMFAGAGNEYLVATGLVRGHDDLVRWGDSTIRATTLLRSVSTSRGFSAPLETVYSTADLSRPTTTADVDGDGVDEFIVSQWDHRPLPRPRLRVMEWTDEGFAFVGDPIDYNLETCGVGLAIAALDVDGDPYEDLIVSTDCKRDGIEGQLYLIRGAPQVEQMHAQISGVSGRTQDGLAVWGYVTAAHDLDGDGVTDLALMDYFGFLVVIRGLGGESWETARLAWDPGNTDQGPLGVDNDNDWEWSFADIDGDGATEILRGSIGAARPVRDPGRRRLPAQRGNPGDHDVLDGR